MVGSINSFLMNQNLIYYCRSQRICCCVNFVYLIESSKSKLHREPVEDEIKLAEELPTFSSESYLNWG
jgi:hypothetical protein